MNNSVYIAFFTEFLQVGLMRKDNPGKSAAGFLKGWMSPRSCNKQCQSTEWTTRLVYG